MRLLPDGNVLATIAQDVRGSRAAELKISARVDKLLKLSL